MNVRNRAIAVILSLVLLVTGCSASVTGQPEVAAAAPVSGGSTASSTGPTSDTTTGADPTTAAGSPTAPAGSEQQTDEQTGAGPTSDVTTAPTTTATSSSVITGSDRSVGPTSIPGLSADCNKVLAAITAFSSVLQGISGGTTGDTISQADVADALQQLPTSGLPSRPQADVDVLRATVKGAVGQSITDLALNLSDGKVVDALQDLSSWAAGNCV